MGQAAELGRAAGKLPGSAMTYVDPLVGKFILIEAVRTAVVEAPIGVGYFLIRFDDTGAPAPGPLAVIDIAELAGSVGADGDPPGLAVLRQR
jgi:hypothetical protein